ncbi:MAG: sortase [Clostridia bacterium]|nr:sortase [Clostridia bacterium]
MNQILYSEHNNLINNKKKKQKKFKLLFYISIFSILCVLFYFSYFSYITNKKEEFSKKLLNNFNVEQLYSDNNNYVTVELNSSGNFVVIGIIEIPKINIKYPILSNINDDLLKIAPCKFYGPFPNEKGNMCIAGHNYDDGRFFSNLHELNIGDIINIYDSNNNMIYYKIYEKFEVLKSNTSCTSQDTNGLKEITLITCNNFNGNRLIIKAREAKK